MSRIYPNIYWSFLYQSSTLAGSGVPLKVGSFWRRKRSYTGSPTMGATKGASLVSLPALTAGFSAVFLTGYAGATHGCSWGGGGGRFSASLRRPRSWVSNSFCLCICSSRLRPSSTCSSNLSRTSFNSRLTLEIVAFRGMTSESNVWRWTYLIIGRTRLRNIWICY